MCLANSITTFLLSTHVQYTQADTIRQTDSPLVPMVGLVPIERDVIPVVLLVNIHLIRETLIIFPCEIMNIPRSISQPRKTILLSQSRNTLIVTKRG